MQSRWRSIAEPVRTQKRVPAGESSHGGNEDGDMEGRIEDGDCGGGKEDWDGASEGARVRTLGDWDREVDGLGDSEDGADVGCHETAGASIWWSSSFIKHPDACPSR